MTDLGSRFKIIDEIASADFVFEAYGKTLNELFCNCAYACSFAMANPEKVEKTRKRLRFIDFWHKYRGITV